jgi:formylglycine-generating enzyme required for sulfatase activity
MRKQAFLVSFLASLSFISFSLSIAFSVFAEGISKPGHRFKDCEKCPEMVVIPPGKFMMGSLKSEKERDINEGPRRKVAIAKAFAVGQFEITRAQFAVFVTETGHDVGKCWIFDKGRWKKNQPNKSYQNPGFHQDDTHPAVCVNWNDAKAYVGWLSRKTKKNYRLLTEAEWEYVARAKTDTPFWWGQSISTSQANYKGVNSKGSAENFRQKTVPVDHFKANEFGLYNVHGNVLEWVEDCWHDNYNGAPTDGTAWITGGDCSKPVLRGGSWFEGSKDLRSADRIYGIAHYRFSNSGFRVARTLAE